MIQRLNFIRASGHGRAVSAAFHLAAVTLLLIGSRTPRVQSVKMPGSASGKHLLLTYSTGGLQSDTKSSVSKQVAPVSKAKLARRPRQIPSAVKRMVMAEQGSGSAGLNGLGDGDMTIALLTNNPRPHPDLSSIPHGSNGNIILNAVIDTHGSIAELTVLQGLSDSIDQQVMATVRSWIFKPATRNGQPVTSEQEIILHYERG